MDLFKVIYPTNAKPQVKELNAAVLTSTFPGKGIHLADLYASDREKIKTPPELVFHGTCAPVLSRLIETVWVEL